MGLSPGEQSRRHHDPHRYRRYCRLCLGGRRHGRQSRLGGSLYTDCPQVVSRASSSSEVLSLNLTNLVILLALKVAIVAFGLFSGGATGRSQTGEELSLGLSSQTDMTGGMCFLLLTGGEEEKLSCVQRAACESPVSARNYLHAAKMWYKMHKLIKAIPFEEKYQGIMVSVNEAMEHGNSGSSCEKYLW